MESLPVDAVEVICRYLSIRDIVACSKVCRSWRELLNDNVIWKPLCSSRKQLVKHLRSTPCAVQPPFVSTHNPDSTLSSPCPLKVALMREKHLWNNIQRGNFKETPINYDKRKGSPYACGFLNDDLVYLLFKTTIEVWDVRKDPAVMFSKISCKWTEPQGKSFTVVGEENELAMISNGFFIAVYEIDFQKGGLELLHHFVFDGVEEKCKSFETHLYDNPKHIVSGSLLVGVNREVSNKIHVWDLKHGHRICEKEVGTSGFCVVDIIGSQSTSNVLIITATKNQRQIHDQSQCTMNQIQEIMIHYLETTVPENRQFIYMIYSLKKNAFLKFKEAHMTNQCSCAITEDFVGIWDMESLKIFNYMTSELFFEGEGPFTYSYRSGCRLAVVGDYFIMNHYLVLLFHPETKSSFEYPLTASNMMILDSICFYGLKVIQELNHLGKPCIHVNGVNKCYQLHQDRMDEIGVFNYISFNLSGTRYISCPDDSTEQQSLLDALTAMDWSKLKKPGESHGKIKQVIIRQFW